MELPRSAHSRLIAFIGVPALLFATCGAVFAQAVSVTLNGSPLTLSPAPTQRAGRVFVPLRGVFEKLGASVVYDKGVINAQGNGRSISLHVGSTQASVNGQPQPLDVAPFVVGASTYVPLRFVSQALGASVNYDSTNKVVAISNGGTAADSAMHGTPVSAVRLGKVQPGNGSVVASRRPTIEGVFSGAQADPNSLRVTLDQLDITSSTSRSPTGFVFSPPSDLQSIAHDVRVTGKDATGQPIDLKWSFTSGTSTVENTLTVANPASGSQVGQQFTVNGSTLPGAMVVVQVGASQNPSSVAGAVGAILGLGGGASVRSEVMANPDGSFSTPVALNAPSGTQLQMVVNSTDPKTKAAAHPVSRTLTIR